MKTWYGLMWGKKRDFSSKVDENDKKRIDMMSSFFINNSDNKVLEVCCGNGYPFASAFSNKCDFSGIDISPHLISIASSNIPYGNFFVGDACDIEYSDNSFDVVFCFHSLWVIKEYEKAIKEMLRVLKNGGKLFIDLRNNKNLDNIEEDISHKNSFHGFGRLKLKMKNFVKIILKKGYVDYAKEPYMFLNDIDNLYQSFKEVQCKEIILYDNSMNTFSLKDNYSETKTIFVEILK